MLLLLVSSHNFFNVKVELEDLLNFPIDTVQIQFGACQKWKS